MHRFQHSNVLQKIKKTKSTGQLPVAEYPDEQTSLKYHIYRAIVPTYVFFKSHNTDNMEVNFKGT